MKKFAVTALAAASLLASGSPSASVPPPMEEWALAQLVKWQPPGKSLYKDAKETEEDGTARYREIVRDAIAVAYDPSEAPLFPGPYGRAKTLATMLGIADSESGFRKDVDLGVGALAKGDSGRSWCMMQIQLGSAIYGKTPARIVMKDGSFLISYDKASGWGGEDLVADRKKCFRAGLHVMRTSFDLCSSLPLEERLSVYASGNTTHGRTASRIRIEKAKKWLAATAPPMDDLSVLAGMKGVTTASVVLNP